MIFPNVLDIVVCGVWIFYTYAYTICLIIAFNLFFILFPSVMVFPWPILVFV